MSRYIIPQGLTGYSVYRGAQYLGVSEVTLPNMTALTQTVSGAGILGEIETPTKGEFGSLTVSLTWRVVEPAAIVLLEPRTHALDFRGNSQVYDKLTGEHRDEAIKISVRGTPKGLDLGRMGANTTTDTANELEITYIKIMVAGRTVLEHDKYNYIHIVNGTDWNAQKRKNLGL